MIQGIKSTIPEVECPYCKKNCNLIKGSIIYPHRKDLAQFDFYYCSPCDALVGCHKGTYEPLGIPANQQLRTLRSRAHNHFDPLWRKGYVSRALAYKKLAEHLGISYKEAHIGSCNEEQCRSIIKWASELHRSFKHDRSSSKK